MKRKIIPALVSALGLLVLILDGKTALAGAADGIELCIRSVVPSLFPFLVLCALLTANLSGLRLPFLRPLCRLTGIPEGGESLLMVGILGGYPMGAQAVSQLYRQGQVSKKSARRLLMYCSNAGPAFIFGIVAPQFASAMTGWALFGIGILSSLLIGILVPHKEIESVEPINTPRTLPQIVADSTVIMARICGWVVLFRILTAFLEHWFLWFLPQDLQILVTGLLELTDGCCSLNMIADEKLRFLVAVMLLNSGGICVWLQTASVVGDLGTASYVKGKLCQALISGFFAWVLISRQYWGIILLVIAAVVCREWEKRGSNSAALGV